jgi:hypothetical protein
MNELFILFLMGEEQSASEHATNAVMLVRQFVRGVFITDTSAERRQRHHRRCRCRRRRRRASESRRRLLRAHEARNRVTRPGWSQ